MDNICHTLAGWAMAEAGLRRAGPLATATCVVGANLPDIDSFAYLFGDRVSALAFRRGWTHGVLAMAVLPVALAGAMVAWDRFVRRRRRPAAEPARYAPLLVVAFLSILSHPWLDFLNTYGVRFLSPFSGRWFYGDALFIVDPWVWIALAVGIVASRRRRRLAVARAERPARIALAGSALYVILMMGSGLLGRVAVAGVAAREGLRFERQMVGPVPGDPFHRQVILDSGGAYRGGSLRLLPPLGVRLDPRADPDGLATPEAREAAATRKGREFLTWSRFPQARVEGSPQVRVVFGDARYPVQHEGDWATAVIPLSKREVKP